MSSKAKSDTRNNSTTTATPDARPPQMIEPLADALAGFAFHATTGDDDFYNHIRRQNGKLEKALTAFDKPTATILEALQWCHLQGAEHGFDYLAVSARLSDTGETQALQVLDDVQKSKIAHETDFLDCVETIINYKRTPEFKAAQKAAKIEAQRQALEAGNLPIIETNNRQDTEKLRDLGTAIAAHNGNAPTVFHGVAGLTKIAHDKDGQPILAAMSRDALQVLAGKSAHWISTTKDGIRNAAPPRDLCEKFMAAPEDWQNIPPVDGIKAAPFIDASGALCSINGYHEGARVVLSLPTNFKLPDTTPTPENIAAAKELILNTILGEVSFVDDASRAAAIALMILPFVRRLIFDQTPQHIFNAPTQSSGKTYTARVCIAPFCDAIPSPEKNSAEENRKSLFAQLATGCSHIFVDNIKNSQSDPTLAAAITTGKLQDRLIGTGHMVTIETNVVWVATSNNAQLDRDAVSRSILIQLDTNDENPESREYQRDPLQYIAENRAQVIAAILTLVRNWQQQGSQPKTGRCKSRFKSWEKVIGGILEANGIEEFLDNFEESRAALDPTADAWREFVGAWRTAHGSEYVTAKKLLETALRCDEMAALIGSDEKKQSRGFGQLLQKQRDKIFAGFKIQRATQRSKEGAKWRLSALNPTENTEKQPENIEKGAKCAKSANSPYPPRDVENPKQRVVNNTFRVGEGETAHLAHLAPFSADEKSELLD